MTAERERHRSGGQLKVTVCQALEPEQSGVAGAGCRGIDDAAHARAHSVGADEDLTGGMGAVGEVRRDRLGVFVDANEPLAVLEPDARLLSAGMQDAVQHAALDELASRQPRQGR